MVALSALRAGGLGILLGIVGALVITRALTTFFYGIRPWDAWTFGGTIILLGALCVAAAIMAARGVTRVEPMRVLRGE
jgi:ABC-type antimicrobial peptide transport system permease subunit